MKRSYGRNKEEEIRKSSKAELHEERRKKN
jgi:hypothetical protein